jgi:hypothetical protein
MGNHFQLLVRHEVRRGAAHVDIDARTVACPADDHALQKRMRAVDVDRHGVTPRAEVSNHDAQAPHRHASVLFA